MIVGIVMLVAIIVCWMEYRALWRQGGRLQELAVSVTLLAAGIALGVLRLFHVELPSAFKLVEGIVEPIHRAVVPLLT